MISGTKTPSACFGIATSNAPPVSQAIVYCCQACLALQKVELGQSKIGCRPVDENPGNQDEHNPAYHAPMVAKDSEYSLVYRLHAAISQDAGRVQVAHLSDDKPIHRPEDGIDV